MTSFIDILLIPVIEDCDLLNYLSRLNVEPEEVEEDNFKYFYTEPEYDGFINSCTFSVDMVYKPEKKYKNIFVMFNGESIESFDKAIKISEKFPTKSVFLVKCNFGNEVPGELLKKLSECKYEIIEIVMGFFSYDCQKIFEISSRDLDKYLKTLKKERKVKDRYLKLDLNNREVEIEKLKQVEAKFFYSRIENWIERTLLILFITVYIRTFFL